MVLGIHDCLIGDLFYCVVLYGATESDLYQTNYPSFPPTTALGLRLQRLVLWKWTFWFQFGYITVIDEKMWSVWCHVVKQPFLWKFPGYSLPYKYPFSGSVSCLPIIPFYCVTNNENIKIFGHMVRKQYLTRLFGCIHMRSIMLYHCAHLMQYGI